MVGREGEGTGNKEDRDGGRGGGVWVGEGE